MRLMGTGEDLDDEENIFEHQDEDPVPIVPKEISALK